MFKFIKKMHPNRCQHIKKSFLKVAFSLGWILIIYLLFLQQLILILKGVLAYAIPDTPNNLQTQLTRELHLRQENLYDLKHKQGSGTKSIAVGIR